MANTRLFLLGGLALALWLNYQAWTIDHAAKPPAANAASATAAQATPGNPPAESKLGESVPTLDASTQVAAASAGSNAAPAAAVAAAADTDSVHVVTDVLDMRISLEGGALIRAELLRYPVHKDHPQIPVWLFNDQDPASMYVLQAGLAGRVAADAPGHQALYSVASKDYRLENAQDELRVPLTWSSAAGVNVTKTFIFRRGSYQIDLDYDVRNASGQAWEGASYARILRHSPPLERSMFDVESYSFRGPAIYDGSKYQKLKVNDDKDKNFSASITG